MGAASTRYGTGAIVLHWLIALALAFQLALGFAMPKNASGFELYQLHKSVGITILVLSLARLAWRLTHRPPPAVEGGLLGALAKSVHVLLYVFMIGGPLTGWAMVSTDAIRIPTVLYGTIPWPHLPLPGAINAAMEESHELIAWIGIALILLHVAGALRHQWLLKDGLLRRIAPGGSAWAAGLLALLVLAVYFGTGMKISSDVVAAGGYETPSEQAEEDVPGPSLDIAAASSDSPSATPSVAASESAAAEEEPGPPPTWAIQPGGRLGFSVDNAGSALRGSFSDWSGTIRFDPENPENAPDIRITVRLASASLGDATQDGMLQGPDFFGTEANPTATWRSTSVTRTGPNRFRANGTLSLKGASRSQALTFTLAGEGLRRKVEGSGTIDRGGFGIGSGEAAAGLAGSVSLSFAFDAAGREP